MEFGFSLNAFQRHGLEESLETLGDIGYDGVEILLDEPHLFPGTADESDVAAVRDLLDANGLAVSNCNAFMLKALEPTAESAAAEYDRDTEAFHHPSFLEPAAEDRRARVEHTKNALETADALGADSISLTPGGPIPNGTSEADAMALFLEGIREVMPTAEEVGVDVLVEPEPELLIETSDDFLEFVDRIDSPRIGCNFDAGHFYCVDEDPIELIDKLSAHTGHYHLEDIPADRTHEHTQLGEGGMDIDGFLRALGDRGYDGFVTVELYPYEETPHETASEAMDYLEEHGWT
ncbi:sugar phosphate isomerase/epimerase [Halorubrum sp. CSM-61]|uniref:sugar phosphate isomerase/epimerase family protein n=1 Tax=Halorubrum sp. CSM-61 TaxID=2485838 RepID=UPI000F4B59E0|nr:sugar phosphate isomerase/epimerase family protein [Halorubrum sp. CSM-61]